MTLRCWFQSSGHGLNSDHLPKRYILALGLLACLTMAIQLLLVETLTVQRRETSLVELTAREEMFSQQLAKAALAVEAADDSQERASRQGELRAVLDDWSASHAGLVAAVRAESGDAGPMPELVAACEASYQAMTARGADLVAGFQRDGQAVDAARVHRDARDILRSEPEFMAAVERLGQYHTQIAQVQMEQFRLTGVAIVSMTLFLLLVQAGLSLVHVRTLSRRQASLELAAADTVKYTPEPLPAEWQRTLFCDERDVLEAVTDCHDAIRAELTDLSDRRQLELFGERMAAAQAPTQAPVQAPAEAPVEA